MPLIPPTRTKPRIILGLMTFGPNKSDGARVTDTAVLGKALDVLRERGYDEVDTARVYIGGEQEAFTRATGWRERNMALATKVAYPFGPGDNSAQRVAESVEKSLSELGADCVDILYLHAPDRGTPFAETLEAVNRLHQAGKFVRLGISNFAAHEVAEVVMTCQHNGWVRPTVYQGMYNVLTRGIERELFVACRRYGLDIVVYNPLAGGLLSGKITSASLLSSSWSSSSSSTQGDAPASGRFSDENPLLGKMYRARYFKDGVFRALQIVEQAAERHGLTLLETALRWAVHHSDLRIAGGGGGGGGGNDGIILGVSSVEQLEQNLDCVERGPLPDGMVEALDEAWEAARPVAVDYWHGKLEYTYDTTKALFAR